MQQTSYYTGSPRATRQILARSSVKPSGFTSLLCQYLPCGTRARVITITCVDVCKCNQCWWCIHCKCNIGYRVGSSHHFPSWPPVQLAKPVVHLSWMRYQEVSWQVTVVGSACLTSVCHSTVSRY